MPVRTLPDPLWFDFFRELPGDGQGRLLVSAQLVPTQGQVIPRPPAKMEPAHPLCIVPESRECYIEVGPAASPLYIPSSPSLASNRALT